MKTVAMIICALGLTLTVSTASAQKVIRAVPRYHPHPRTHVVVGVGMGAWGPYYPYYYSPFYAYPPAYGYYARPSKLDLEIQDIRNDYQDRIWSARHDDSLTRKQKRQKVHELKHERDQEILNAKKDYYKRY
jgi:hypothetical protein